MPCWSSHDRLREEAVADIFTLGRLGPHALLGGSIQFPGASEWHQLFPVEFIYRGQAASGNVKAQRPAGGT
jgi:hypothetical protein